MSGLSQTKISGQPCVICCHQSTCTPEDREYIRCMSCGALRTRYNYNPNVYGTGYAKNYMSYAKTDVNTPLNLCRVGLVSRWLKEGDKILDIGCCVGEFLRFAEHYYKCVGFEPNTQAARLARNRCSSSVTTKLDGDIPKVHCITMFDVLEHIEFPHKFLELLVSQYMEPQAVIVLTTPNVEVIPSWNDDSLRKWKHYKPEEHLWLYTEQALTHLFTATGLETIYFGREESDIRPGNPEGDILTCVARKI